jgi:hypothetical protein
MPRRRCRYRGTFGSRMGDRIHWRQRRWSARSYASPNKGLRQVFDSASQLVGCGKYGSDVLFRVLEHADAPSFLGYCAEICLLNHR